MTDISNIAAGKIDEILKDLYEDGLNASVLKPPSNVIELYRKEILSITEIAVVNRKAELPYPHTVLYAFYRKLLSKENWVKEIVKDAQEETSTQSRERNFVKREKPVRDS